MIITNITTVPINTIISTIITSITVITIIIGMISRISSPIIITILSMSCSPNSLKGVIQGII